MGRGELRCKGMPTVKWKSGKQNGKQNVRLRASRTAIRAMAVTPYHAHEAGEVMACCLVIAAKDEMMEKMNRTEVGRSTEWQMGERGGSDGGQRVAI